MNAASWHTVKRSSRDFARELSYRAPLKCRHTLFLKCSQGPLKSHNFQVLWQSGHTRAHERRVAWWKEGTAPGKLVTIHWSGHLSQKKQKSRIISRKVLAWWPCTGCNKKKSYVLIYRSELNSCEKAIWDSSKSVSIQIWSLSLRMKSLLRGWFSVQSLTLLSFFSCWSYQTELQATSEQHPSCAFHKLAVAEHLAQWMLQVCYFNSPCDLFELASCNPIPQL